MLVFHVDARVASFLPVCVGDATDDVAASHAPATAVAATAPAALAARACG